MARELATKVKLSFKLLKILNKQNKPRTKNNKFKPWFFKKFKIVFNLSIFKY